MNDELKAKLENIKNSVLIFDIETAACYPGTTTPINIATNFEDYVKFAKTKFFGCYSFKYDKLVCDEVYGNEEKIKQFIQEHDILVGFNNEEFDTPICYNNSLMPDKFMKQLDLLPILGSSTYQNHKGLPFKNRGALMGYKFKKNSLKAMAEAMELETQKGDIDYNIFFQDMFTDEERADIIKYLESDILATKQMFEKVWDYWLPFTEFLSEADVLNLSWIKSSIASLTYKAACNVLGIEATYAEKPENTFEEMGGRVIAPKYEEAKNVWYVDFTSLYPHIFTMFNLFNEVKDNLHEWELDQGSQDGSIWHGNELFQVRGHYWTHEHHPLAIDVAKKLKQRIEIKKQIKETGVYNPTEYAIKIFLNSLYGAVRSPIFEQIHTPNAGWDCCWLGQQIQKLAEDMMTEFGFETIAGDTDSIFVIFKDSSREFTDLASEREYVKSCLKQIVDKIKANVPFPAETYNIDIEEYLHYVMWPFEEQPINSNDGSGNIKIVDKSMTKDEMIQYVQNRCDVATDAIILPKGRTTLVTTRQGKKKNYLYIYEKRGEMKLKIAGMPIIKDNSTLLGPKILNEVLKPIMLDKITAKFPKEYIENLLEEYLSKDGALDLLTTEYKVKPVDSYKNPAQIQAQISAGYFNGQDGVIRLLKNKKVGKAGKGSKYCTVEEARENKLHLKDLDLEKVNNELAPFMGN